MYMRRRPFGPSSSSKRRQRRSTSWRAPDSAGQPVLGWRALVDPGEDLLRLAEHAVGRHQHGNRDPAARPPRGELMDALDMALLAIGDSGTLERPACLLAVVDS